MEKGDVQPKRIQVDAKMQGDVHDGQNYEILKCRGNVADRVPFKPKWRPVSEPSLLHPANNQRYYKHRLTHTDGRPQHQ
jgi:hypothetical protein